MGHLTMSQAFLWIEKLSALAVLLQTIELLQLKKVYENGGIWTWDLLAAEYSPRGRAFLGLFLGIGFIPLLYLQLLAATALLFVSSPILPAVMSIVSLLVAVRWRGAFNGGADSMTLIVLLCLSLAGFSQNPQFRRGCLWYIAIQVVLSFWLSGLAKWRQPDWRSGQAIRQFLLLRSYGAPEWTRRLAGSPVFYKAMAWSILIFEASFPLALLNLRTATIYVVMGIIFNLLNFWLIGLNRFVFAWLAAYPAIFVH